MKKVLTTLLSLMICLDVQGANVKLGVEFEGLSSMKAQHYEGWSIIEGKPYSTGRFSITKHGYIYQVNAQGRKLTRIGKNGMASFNVSTKHLNAKVFVLTVEPNGDTDQGPSAVHVMGGDFNKRSADLSISHGSSLGTDFNGSSGSYILAAPTGGNANQGVWFFDPSNGSAALNLPELPAGFAYEGWIVNTKKNAKLSTGIFKEVSGIDSDAAGPFAGGFKLSFPMFPGQDIVGTNILLDDGIHSIIITVEPYPDYDPAPFVIKVLKADIYAGTPGMTSMPLKNISNSAPKGVAHFH